jgi:hypothetical protein
MKSFFLIGGAKDGYKADPVSAMFLLAKNIIHPNRK